MKFLVTVERGEFSKVEEIFKPIKKLFDYGIMIAINTPLVKRKLDKELHRNKIDEIMCCNINAKKKENSIIINVDVDIFDYEKLVCMADDFIKDNDNIYITRFGKAVLTTINSTLSKEIKEELIINIVNACPKEIGKTIEEILFEKKGLPIEIESISATKEEMEHGCEAKR